MRNKYHYWTSITAFCFERRCKCEGCCESYVACKVEPFVYNQYGMKPVKYAALQTYANIGLKGFKEALYKIGKPKNRMKDVTI